MTRSRKISGAFALPALLALLGAAPARAEFEPIQLVSKDAIEQADEAREPALSADGRFVAFAGSIGARKGVFRKNLVTGAIEEVVAADAYGSDPRAGSSAPSISADGRYVSFTTTAQLSPNDQAAGSSDVYVADMATSPPTYELASALNGVATGLTYDSASGAIASGRVALSADGREVVFVVRAKSNLTGDPTKTETPERQVALRYLDEQRTTLVSAQRDPSSGQMVSESPVPGGAVAGPEVGVTTIPPLGAALSADGTTVAWLGSHLPAQVPLLADEAKAIASLDKSEDHYNEPLWRRVADGPLAPTRRIVGGGDPSAPGCPPGGTLLEPACQGPFPDISENPPPGSSRCQAATGWLHSLRNSSIDGVPQLSANGRIVALIGAPDEFSDVFVADMSDGLDRREAVRQLTGETPLFNPCEANVPANVAATGGVFDVAISPDGNQIAFTTARQRFPLAPPSLVGSVPSSASLTELYRIDLGGEVLERVTRSASGEGPSTRSGAVIGEEGASSPSFSADGQTLAFASKASNLVSGDTNGASDVFVVSARPSSTGPGEVDISPALPGPQPKPRGRLALTAVSQPNGGIRLLATVPAAGALRARADALVGPDLRARRVAAGRRHARGAGLLALHLEPARRFRRLVHTRLGLEAELHVDFSQPGRTPLREEIAVRFRARPKATGARRGAGR